MQDMETRKYIDKLKSLAYEYITSEGYKPKINKDIFLDLEIDEEDRLLLYEALEELYREGKIYKTKKGKYCTPEMMNIHTGTLEKHERGFGFLVRKDRGLEDIFIPRDKMNGAMHLDKVAVKMTKAKTANSKAEGEVIAILSHEKSRMVGRYEKSRNFGFVVVDDRKFTDDIYIKKADDLGAEDGDKVVVEIEVWPKGGRSAEGRIVEILGKVGEKGVDVLSILRAYGFNEEFPKEVLNEAEEIPDEVSEEEMKGRRDLRDYNIFTIDGEDTKDIDDAVSIEKLDNDNYRLGVHIADVSYYVKEGTLLDEEAYNRGTSVYMVDRVAPMLPKKLSNGICSLNPGVTRLALSVLMDIDKQGNVYNHEIFKSVIKSKEQMTYENLYKILEEDDEELKRRYEYLLEDFYLMKELALILRAKRMERGAIDFDLPEPKVIIDEDGKPIDIVRRELTIANRIIEEFMLVCNETIAEHFYWLDIPFVYRIHEEPESEKVINFSEFVRVMGYRLKGTKSGNVHPRAFQELLEDVKGKDEERVISTIMLRSMQKARYSDKRDVHFGLAAAYYTHFTSPIRRYPDLTIHRIISESLEGKLTDERIAYLREVLDERADHCSYMERAAESAERESVRVKMTEFMSTKIGEVFEGVISSIVSFGMFVELDNLIEGLVRVSTMNDDYYIFDEKNYRFVGERTKKVYKIGDKVKLILTNIDLLSRTIEFELLLGYNE